MDNTTLMLQIWGVLALILALAFLVSILVSFFKKWIVFQGKVVAKQKMNRDGLMMPDSEVPTYKEENVRYQVTIEYCYKKTKKVEDGHLGEIREVEISKTLKQSSFRCDNEVQFANYQIGQTYWFAGEDKKDSYVVVV